MASTSYVTITGATQGPITENASSPESVGNDYQEPHKDKILVQAIKSSIIIPRNPQSGQPSGQRVHEPFCATVALNSAVPKLYQALCQGEVLTEVVFEVYRTAMSGIQEAFFEIRLVDAILVDMDLVLPHAQDPRNANFTQNLEMKMNYRKIIWNHLVANTTGEDDWRLPNVGQ